MLSIEELTKKVEENLSAFRFQHSIRVSEYAATLAKLNDFDEQKARIAGLIHDYAKELPKEVFLTAIDKYQLNRELKKWSPAIWHGIVGAEIIRDELKIDDQEILDAVRVHTTADVEMPKLSKILYMADWLEPGRELDSDLLDIKKETELNLDYGIRQQLIYGMQHLTKIKAPIYPKTLFAYNWWVGETK